MKTNQEKGIITIKADLTPIIEELEHKKQIDLTKINIRHRRKLGIIAKNTGIIEYTKTIRKKTPYKIIEKNTKHIKIQKI